MSKGARGALSCCAGEHPGQRCDCPRSRDTLCPFPMSTAIPVLSPTVGQRLQVVPTPQSRAGAFPSSSVKSAPHQWCPCQGCCCSHCRLCSQCCLFIPKQPWVRAAPAPPEQLLPPLVQQQKCLCQGCGSVSGEIL